jgi:hypothetical protein
MRKTITIKLTEPLKGHSGPIDKIVLREPSFSEYLEHGDPYTLAGSGGSVFMVESPEVIRKYIDLCIVEPNDAALLEQAGARVARDMKREFLASFFEDAGGASAASEKSATI